SDSGNEPGAEVALDALARVRRDRGEAFDVKTLAVQRMALETAARTQRFAARYEPEVSDQHEGLHGVVAARPHDAETAILAAKDDLFDRDRKRLLPIHALALWQRAAAAASRPAAVAIVCL